MCIRDRFGSYTFHPPLGSISAVYATVPPLRQYAQWFMKKSLGLGRIGGSQPHLPEMYAPRFRGSHMIPWPNATETKAPKKKAALLMVMVTLMICFSVMRSVIGSKIWDTLCLVCGAVNINKLSSIGELLLLRLPLLVLCVSSHMLPAEPNFCIGRIDD